MTTSWARIGLHYAIGVLAAGQMGLVPPLVPALQRDLDLSLAEAEAAVSAITLMGALFGLAAGRWCESTGHARALAIGLLVMAIAAALCAMVEQAIPLLAARGLAGIGYLMVVIAAPSLMAAIAEPRHHPIALSLWGTFVPAGIALAGFASAGLAGMGWRMVFWLDALVLALATLAAFLSSRAQRGTFPAAPRVPRFARDDSGGDRHDMAGSLDLLKKALPLAFAFFCFALLFLALAGLLPDYLVERRGLAPAEAGRLGAVAAIFAIAGSFAAPWFLRRGVAPAKMVALGLLGSTVAAALSFSLAVPVPLEVAGFALAYAVGGLVPAASFSFVPALAGGGARGVGLLNGLLAQTGSLGSLAGPPALALWIGWAGWEKAPVLLIMVAVAGAAATLAVRRASRPPRTTSCPAPPPGGRANRPGRGSC